MLESVVQDRELKIYKLTEELKTFEASTSVNNLPICGQCGGESEEENDTDKDYKDTTSSKNHLKCDECDFSSDEGRMKVHITEMHDMSFLTCELCDFRTRTAEIMKNHKIEKHQLKCEYCNESFIGERKL